MLITLCASHITSLDDITRIKEMIASHDNQTLKTKLYISISYENDLLEYIQEFESNNTILYIRDNPTTQFMHYKLLVNDLLPIYKNIHVLFTDDDDILHPNRNATYAQYLNHKIIKINSIKILCDEFGFNKEHITEGKPDEYVNLCIRLNIISEILNNKPDDELNKWLCDVDFNMHVSHYYNIYRLPYPIGLYYYRKHFMKRCRYTEQKI
jgi:hypothetical protein